MKKRGLEIFYNEGANDNVGPGLHFKSGDAVMLRSGGRDTIIDTGAWTNMNMEAVRLAMQGPLASYFPDVVYNPETDKRGEAEIIIAKQRNGPVGTVELLYQASITRFLNKAVNNQYAQV